ncbi:hypothetical protein TRVA0_001S04918 [Trichomonascus vanleenenianus]|uniref:F-box protein n=1 Tax=Trichomonascus vanleenenianus TaxID=2268995 RepID=UPI003EC9CC98
MLPALPNELLREVVSQLPLADLRNLRQACRSLDDVIEPLLWGTLVLDFRQSELAAVGHDNGHIGHYLGQNQSARVSSGQIRVSRYNFVQFQSLATANVSFARKLAHVKRLELIGGLALPLRALELGSNGSIQQKEVDSKELDLLLGVILPSRLTQLAELEIDFAGDVLLTKYEGLERLLNRVPLVAKSIHVHWMVEPPSGIPLAGPIKHLSFTLAGVYSIKRVPSTVEHLTVYAVRRGVGPSSIIRASDIRGLLEGTKCLSQITLARFSIDQDVIDWLPQSVCTVELDLVSLAAVSVTEVHAVFPQVKSLILGIEASTSRLSVFRYIQFPAVEFLSIACVFERLEYGFEIPSWLRPTTLQLDGMAVSNWGSIARKFHNLNDLILSHSFIRQPADMHIIESVSRGLDGVYVDKLTVDLGFTSSLEVTMVSRTLHKSCKELYLYDAPYQLPRAELLKPAPRDYKFEKAGDILEGVDLGFTYKGIYRQDDCTVKGYRVLLPIGIR